MMRQYISDVIAHYNVSQDAVQVGVVTYGGDPQVTIPLGMFPNATTLNGEINNLASIGNMPNIAEAIESSMAQLFSVNGRSNARKVMIVLVSQPSNDAGATSVAAATARMRAVDITAVGFGSNYDSIELNTIATDPDNTHVFDSSVTNSTERINQTTCSGRVY